MVFGGGQSRAVNRPFTNTQPFGYLRPREPFSAQHVNPVQVRIDAWAAKLLSFRARVTQSSFDALHNQAALQFGDRAENGEDQFAGGCVVLSCSEKETNSMPWTLKLSRALSRWLTDRAKRSNFQTTTASNRRRCASAIRRSSYRRSYVTYEHWLRLE